jgi:precorrin-2 dehydrogenase / sirohydrochlorin ferrochelatase
MKYYPVCLDVSGRKCVVIGGGDVAERKVRRLLDCGARVIVVSPALTEGLESLKTRSGIEHINVDYEPRFIEGAFLVVGATDDRDIHKRIFSETRGRGILVNIVDDPALCDFILPSLVSRGDLLISVATGGKSPALAKKLREELEELYGPEYGALLTIMSRVREKVLVQGKAQTNNRDVFESILGSDIIEHIRKGEWEKVRKIIRELADVDVDMDEAEGEGRF